MSLECKKKKKKEKRKLLVRGTFKPKITKPAGVFASPSRGIHDTDDPEECRGMDPVLIPQV